MVSRLSRKIAFPKVHDSIWSQAIRGGVTDSGLAEVWKRVLPTVCSGLAALQGYVDNNIG